jgi:hypothetical protein
MQENKHALDTTEGFLSCSCTAHSVAAHVLLAAAAATAAHVRGMPTRSTQFMMHVAAPNSNLHPPTHGDFGRSRSYMRLRGAGAGPAAIPFAGAGSAKGCTMHTLSMTAMLALG